MSCLWLVKRKEKKTKQKLGCQCYNKVQEVSYVYSIHDKFTYIMITQLTLALAG